MQKTIERNQGFGVVGEIAFDSPIRAFTGILNSTDATNNVIGRYFTRNTDNTLGAGGTGKSGGILASPKTYAAEGNATGTLAPTLTLHNGEVGEFVEMGEIIVQVDTAIAIGAPLYYNTTTGVITTASGTNIVAIPNCVVSRFAQKGTGGMAIAKLTN